MNQTNKSKLCAVTGATGFLGSTLCRHLLGSGHRVRAVFRNPDRLSELEGLEIESVLADVTDPSAIDHALKGVDCVFHIAALFRQAGVPDSTFRQVNVEGTRNVLQSAAKQNVRRVVHCSTVGVHGHIADPPATENTAHSPGDVYQETKAEGEKLALEWFRSGRVDGCVIRPAMIWGPGDTRTLKLYRGIATRRLPVIGTGKVLHHYVLVHDVARGMELAASTPHESGEVYIIAGERSISVQDLFAKIAGQLGVSLLPFRVPARPIQLLGDAVEHLCRPLGIEPPIYRRRVDFFTKTRSFDCSKAEQQLGYRPGQSLEDEIGLIVESYRSLGWI